MSRLSRQLACVLLLHHIDGVCRVARGDAVADAMSVIVASFAEQAAALVVGAPRRSARAALPRHQARPRPAIEAAPAVHLSVAEQVAQYDEGERP